MAKYNITYSVELDEAPNRDTALEAYYWLDKVLRNSDTDLPEHVLWVKTLPDLEKVA
jgi:hypothetical protein